MGDLSGWMECCCERWLKVCFNYFNLCFFMFILFFLSHCIDFFFLGDWVLIDNVNFCVPTVLDRLNPLVEPNGYLVVNERGSDERFLFFSLFFSFLNSFLTIFFFFSFRGEQHVVKPHPNFRLFLAMDPASGEISRAMRNRGIEMVLLPPTSAMSDPGFFFFSPSSPFSFSLF